MGTGDLAPTLPSLVAEVHMQVRAPDGERVGTDVRLTLDMDLGAPVQVDAHCYAMDGRYLYIHVNDATMAHGLPSRSLVLVDGTGGEKADTHPLPRCRGLLERVREEELGPHVALLDRASAPVWRVWLDASPGRGGH